MKTKQQLDQLSAKVTEALQVYLKAIENNLLKLGHPVAVQEVCNMDETGIRLNVQLNDNVNEMVFDQIRCEKAGSMEIHCIHWDYSECDRWMNWTVLGDAAQYLFDAIQWQE